MIVRDERTGADTFIVDDRCPRCAFGPHMHDRDTGRCPIRYLVELTPHGHYIVDLDNGERIAGPMQLEDAERQWRAIEPCKAWPWRE